MRGCRTSRESERVERRGTHRRAIPAAENCAGLYITIPVSRESAPSRIDGRVCELLKRIVLHLWRSASVRRRNSDGHRPDARKIARREKDRAVMAADDLRNHVQHTGGGKDPHEGEVPPQRAPSQPPRVIAFGTASIRSRSGIFGPKLGNAFRILRPLIVRIVIATAVLQWHNRTAQGCSYTGRRTPVGDVILRVLRASCSPGRPNNSVGRAARGSR